MHKIKKELQSIINSKIMLVSFIVICFIPTLYSSFFLKSIWDPYGNTQHMPVAVVNNDKAVEFNGKKLDIGNELENKLREDKNLSWSFVSNEEAKNGLENNKYYMVLTIDKNFSKNAATLLDKKPRQMIIKYTTNGSANYLSEVIGEAASKQIEKEVSENVTKAYTEIIFEQIKQTGAGLKQASDGAMQLNSGSQKIEDGNKSLLKNLNSLSQSTILFKNGTKTFKKGLSQYLAAIIEVNNGTIKLSDGTTMLVSATPTLTSAVTQLETGSSALNNGIIKYTSAIRQADENANNIVKNNATLSKGMNALNDSFANIEELVNSNNKLLSALNITSEQLPDNNATEINELKEINNSLQALKSEVSTSSANKIDDEITGIQNNISRLKSKPIFNSSIAINNITSNSLFQGLDAQSQEALTSILQQELVKYDTNNNSEIASIENSLIHLKDNTTNLNKAVDESHLQAAINQIAENADIVIPKVSTELSTDASVKTKINTEILPGLNKVNVGLELLNNSSSKINEFNMGFQQYLNGTNLLSNGLNLIIEQDKQLLNGSKQLNNGLNTLNDKSIILTKSIKQLDEGTKKLKSGTQILNKNNKPLLNGITSIDSNATLLSDGAKKIYNGDALIAEALSSLNDGSFTLSTKLKDGASKIDSIKTNDDTISMFASPDKLVHEKYTSVANYGHALAPYVLSLALYVGCLVFSVIIPLRISASKTSTTKNIWLSKILLGLVAALSMTLIETGIMHLLGLNPLSNTQYVLSAFVSAFAYMFLIQLLATAFDNAGRFIAMILLILQLACAGGTFPIQLSGSFFNAVHKYIPMTYSVTAFRNSISGGIENNTFNLSLIILIIIGCISIILLYFVIDYLKNKKMIIAQDHIVA